MYHFYVNDLDRATEVLDWENIPYDLDSGDRIMIDEAYIHEMIEALDAEGLNYEEVG